MTSFPHALDPVPTGRMGLIVLQADETIEDDFRRLLPASARLLVSRVPSGAELTPETIGRMAEDLPAAAALFPRCAAFASVGYACTSGTALIGAERVATLVRQGCPAEAVRNPLDAALAACEALGARRIGLVSPYTADIAARLQALFEAAGLTVPAAISFGEEIEAHVARISAASQVEAARAAARTGVDAVFLSCTNLRTLDLIGPLEAELGMPVFGSNLALARQMARDAGVRLNPLPSRLLAA